MKLFIATILITSSVTSFAQTTLRIPLFAEQKDKLIPMAEINKKFKTKFPTELVVTDSKDSVDKVRDLYWEIQDKIQDVNDLELANDIPGNNRVNDIRTCYTGDAAIAVDLALGMSDSIYSDQLGLIGWKYKNETHLSEDIDADQVNDVKKAIEADSKLWKNWKGYNDSILILTHQTDDGTDTNEGLIVKCK